MNFEPDPKDVEQFACDLLQFQGTGSESYSAHDETAATMLSHGYRMPPNDLGEDYRQLISDLREMQDAGLRLADPDDLAEALLEYGWRR